MNEILNNFIEGLIQSSLLEWLAVFFSLLYVIFAALEKRICWIFGFISSILLVYICYSVDLYFEVFLQFFYVGMAVVGWLKWKKSSTEIIAISSDYVKKNLIISVFLACLGGILGYIFATYTLQKYPYTDAMVFVFSLYATHLTSIKKIENWMYWIVIDTVCIFLFLSRGLELVAFQYIFFTLAAAWGFWKWLVVWKR